MYILQNNHYEKYEGDYTTQIAVSESKEALKQKATEDEEVTDQQWDGDTLVVYAVDSDGRDCSFKESYSCDYYTITKITQI